MSDSGNDGLAQTIVATGQLVFSLTFPLLLITLCAISFVLADAFHMAQFASWADLARWAFAHARTNIWVMLLIAALVIGALPMAWVAYKERAVPLSSVVMGWVFSGLFTFGSFWLANAWAADGGMLQEIVFGFLLLLSWGAILETAGDTLKLYQLQRANRPPPPPVKQQPHGSPDEPETI